MARITGISGAVYLGSPLTKFLDVYDWVFESTTDTQPVDIKGDYFHRFVADAGGARFTAKRRNQAFAIFSPLAPIAASNNALAFRLDLVDASGSYTQITGSGIVTSGSVNAPRDVVDDTMELLVDGAWTQT